MVIEMNDSTISTNSLKKSYFKWKNKKFFIVFWWLFYLSKIKNRKCQNCSYNAYNISHTFKVFLDRY